jgi:hypothetical protein
MANFAENAASSLLAIVDPVVEWKVPSVDAIMQCQRL